MLPQFWEPGIVCTAPVEVEKTLTEQGHYLHPELFNAPPELEIGAMARQLSPSTANGGSR